MVSVTEAHTTSVRSFLNQKRLEDDIIVAWNYEDTFHCDAVVQEALDWGPTGDLLGEVQDSC